MVNFCGLHVATFLVSQGADGRGKHQNQEDQSQGKEPHIRQDIPTDLGFFFDEGPGVAGHGRTEGGDQTQLTCKTRKFQQQIAVPYDDPMTPVGCFWPAMGPEQRLRSSCSAK